MSKKTIWTIIAIIVIPVLAFCILTFNKDSAIAQGGKPQILKFSSTMCLECKEVEKIFNEIMPKYQGDIEYVSIIVDSGKDMNNKLIKKHNIKLVPTVVMINSDGTTAKRIEGAIAKEEYEKCIKGLK